MEKAIIYFSDKSTIELKENDCITPITRFRVSDGKEVASMGASVELLSHIYNGLIPSIMDALLKCDFFFINHDHNTTYNSKAIVKITLA